LDKLLKSAQHSPPSSIDLDRLQSTGMDWIDAELDRLLVQLQGKKRSLEHGSFRNELRLFQSFLNRTKNEKLQVECVELGIGEAYTRIAMLE
jgi:hypothetical protein